MYSHSIVICKFCKILQAAEKGFGLFAGEDFEPGVFICEYAGEFIGAVEVERRNGKRPKTAHNYVLTLKEVTMGSCIDPLLLVKILRENSDCSGCSDLDELLMSDG